jgi:hypothetical protein
MEGDPQAPGTLGIRNGGHETCARQVPAGGFGDVGNQPEELNVTLSHHCAQETAATPSNGSGFTTVYGLTKSCGLVGEPGKKL